MKPSRAFENKLASGEGVKVGSCVFVAGGSIAFEGRGIAYCDGVCPFSLTARPEVSGVLGEHVDVEFSGDVRQT